MKVNQTYFAEKILTHNADYRYEPLAVNKFNEGADEIVLKGNAANYVTDYSAQSIRDLSRLTKNRTSLTVVQKR